MCNVHYFNVYTFRPKDCRQITTEFRFWRSQRSTLWNVSCTGTPKFLAVSRKAKYIRKKQTKQNKTKHTNKQNRQIRITFRIRFRSIYQCQEAVVTTVQCRQLPPEIFSIHLKAILLSLTFLMQPGCRQLDNLQSSTPSLSTSKKLSISPEVLIGSPVMVLIHSRHSWANSSLYLEFIYK